MRSTCPDWHACDATAALPSACRIACALYAQFGPGKFPGTWWTVLACVVLYIVLTVTMNWYSWKAEGESFLVTRPFKVGHGGRCGTAMRTDDRHALLQKMALDDHRLLQRMQVCSDCVTCEAGTARTVPSIQM